MRLLYVVAVVAGLAAFMTLTGCHGDRHSTKAVIIDQLSTREPNPAFVEGATAVLEEAGYAVDYYPSEQATVRLYHELPTLDYDIVVLRAHSAIPEKDLSVPRDVPQEVIEPIMERIGDDVLLFTSEPYEEAAYNQEQRSLQVLPVVYPGDSWDNAYFAVGSEFVRSSPGRFPGSIVILMGCRSLSSSRTAAAFLDKGASAVVGWNDTVSPSHTDAATEQLLRYLTRNRLPVEEAVERTMTDMGPDPWYGARMSVYD